MVETPDPQVMRELESELKECARQGDSLEALDIYDELDAKGWIRPRHLVGMGHCLIKLRRKQDAREAWLRAYSADTSFQEVIDVLDEFFPGWKRATPPPPRPAPPPAPPPAQVPSPPPAASASHGSETREASAYRPPLQAAPEPDAAARASASMQGQAVNWEYVLADVEESSHALERARREAASITADEKMPEFSLNMTAPGSPPPRKRRRGKK